MLSAAAQHVLILSIDGTHEADLTDPQLQADLTNINALRSGGVTYTNASTTSPSDSFPATTSIFTGANPGTTGVFYDDSYSRTLLPSVDQGGGTTPGTPTNNDDAIDINGTLLDGGGNSDATSIDPNELPISSTTGQPVYPNQQLQVNTIYDVAAQAGLYTALIEKRPSYQILNGNNANAIDDFYAPEIAATAALYDPSTGQTVDADALLASNPTVNVSKYTLVDASTDPLGANDPNLVDAVNGNTLLTEAFDNMRTQALINEINGQASHASPTITDPKVPNLFSMNFQAITTAEESVGGGIAKLPNGKEGAPSAMLQAAFENTDTDIGEITAALKNAGLWSSTRLFLTSKQGQNPRVGTGSLIADSTMLNVLSSANINVATEIPDDVSLIYLADQTQTSAAVKALTHFKSTGTFDVYLNGVKKTEPASKVIDKILSGNSLKAAKLGSPATDSTTPDIIVTLKPGIIIAGDPTTQSTNADHGGFTTDDTKVPLIVSGGAMELTKAKTVGQAVQLQQIAVSALDSLGLDPDELTGAVADHTKALPGLGS